MTCKLLKSSSLSITTFSSFFSFRFLYLGLPILLSCPEACYALVRLLGLTEAVTLSKARPTSSSCKGTQIYQPRTRPRTRTRKRSYSQEPGLWGIDLTLKKSTHRPLNPLETIARNFPNDESVNTTPSSNLMKHWHYGTETTNSRTL